MIHIIELKNIYKSFGKKEILSDFSLTIPTSEKVCLFGKSGIGKSTIFNIIANLEKFDKGTMLGLENKKISYVFQDTRLITWLSVAENLTVVMKNANKKEKHELADFYLGKFNLLEYKNKMPCELSGGMQQKLSIARALAFNGDIFLFDEPFKGLDEKSKFSTIGILKDELINKTALFITHDLSEISSLCDIIFYFEGSPISGEIKPSML